MSLIRMCWILCVVVLSVVSVHAQEVDDMHVGQGLSLASQA